MAAVGRAPAPSDLLRRVAERRGALAIAYVATACCAFPITEALVLGREAPQYAHDVFDEGVVTRLGVIAADWSQHGLSLWNPYLGGGNAWLAQFGQPPVSLDVLLSFLLPPFWAYAITYLLIVAAAGFGMHLFLRDSMKLSPAACFAGGIVYQLGFWHYVLGFAVALLPGMLWLAGRALDGSRRRPLCLAAGVLLAAFLFYNSHAQLTVLVAALQLAYVACGPAGRRLERVRDWLLVWALGLALYGPVLLTQLEHLPESQRAIWDLTYMLPATMAAAGRKMLAVYGNTVFGVPVSDWLGQPQLTYGTFFVGFVGLPLLAMSLWKAGRTRGERFVALLPWCLLLLEAAYLISLAAVQWQEHAGVLKSFQVTRVRHLVPFALAANVAVGLHAVERGTIRRPRRGVVRLLWALLGVAIGWQLVASGLEVARLPVGGSLPDLVRFVGWALALVYFLLAAGAWLGLSLGHGAARRSAAVLAWGLLAVLAGDRLVYSRIQQLVEPRLNSFARAVQPTPGIVYLQARDNDQAHRVLSVDEHPNRLMFARLQVANGYQQIYPLRYHQLFGLLTAPRLERDRWAHDYFHRWGNRAYVYGPELDLDIASLMGVRWIYTLETRFSRPGLVERFRGEREAVYENLAVLPRAFLVGEVRAFADRRRLLEALSEATADELREQAYVLEASGLELRPGPGGPASDSSAEIVEYTPDRVTVEARTADPAVLVLTDVNAPGWRAFLNGAETRIFEVYNAFRGVRVPAGSQRVEFRYLPAATARGARLATAALVAATAWLLAVALLDRRRRHRSAARSDRSPGSEAR